METTFQGLGFRADCEVGPRTLMPASSSCGTPGEASRLNQSSVSRNIVGINPKPSTLNPEQP